MKLKSFEESLVQEESVLLTFQTLVSVSQIGKSVDVFVISITNGAHPFKGVVVKEGIGGG